MQKIINRTNNLMLQKKTNYGHHDDYDILMLNFSECGWNSTVDLFLRSRIGNNVTTDFNKLLRTVINSACQYS